MAAESIIGSKKPGFPKTGNSESGTTSTIEYIGLATAIDSALPDVGDAWGDYPGTVKSVTYNPTENALVTDATVVVEVILDNEDVETGTLEGVSYEIRWVTVARPMYEHPQFATNGGGANALTSADIFDLKMWQLPDEREDAKDVKELYRYKPVDAIDPASYVALSSSARLFARGIELGQDTFEDKAPTAVKISSYINGPPPETDAGLKQDPIGVPNIPAGYEWRKETADSTKAGSETRWTLTEEWQGAKKVLSDRETIYWAAP